MLMQFVAEQAEQQTLSKLFNDSRGQKLQTEFIRVSRLSHEVNTLQNTLEYTEQRAKM